MPQRPQPSAGSFYDELDRLLEQLAASPLTAPQSHVASEKQMPAKRPPRIGRCPQLHNRLLLDSSAWAVDR
jgi:hypothetical protein